VAAQSCRPSERRGGECGRREGTINIQRVVVILCLVVDRLRAISSASGTGSARISSPRTLKKRTIGATVPGRRQEPRRSIELGRTPPEGQARGIGEMGGGR